MSKVVILQSNYMPWKGYFDLINDADIFVFYDVVKYTKNNWRNRNIIYTKNGKQWLTVPVDSRAVNLPINEVGLNNTEWQKLHFRTLELGYKKAPYFFQLEELIYLFYRERTWHKISELNQFCIQTICKKLAIKTQFVNAENLKISGERIEKLVSILKQVNATEYITGPAARDYLSGNENIFSENDIALSYKKYGGYSEYKQLNSPFEHGVSILDLVANINWQEMANYIWKKQI